MIATHICIYIKDREIRHKVHQQHDCQAGPFGIEARSYRFRGRAQACRDEPGTESLRWIQTIFRSLQ